MADYAIYICYGFYMGSRFILVLGMAAYAIYNVGVTWVADEIWFWAGKIMPHICYG